MYCDIGSNSFPNPPWFTSKSTLSAKIWRNKQKTITVEEILFWVSAACCRSCRAGVPPARDTKNAPRNPPASPPERDKTSLTLDSEYLRSHLHPGKKWFHSMSKHFPSLAWDKFTLLWCIHNPSFTPFESQFQELPLFTINPQGFSYPPKNSIKIRCV